jgi:hypothetical protein
MYRLAALRSAGKTEPFLAVVAQAARSLPEEAACRLVNQTARDLMRDAASALLRDTLAAAAATAQPGSAMDRTVRVLTLDGWIAERQWAQLEAGLIKESADLPDGDFGGVLQRGVSALLKDGRFEETDRVCVALLEKLGPDAPSRNRAATLWLRSAAEHKDLAALVSRLGALREKDFPPDFVFRHASNRFHAFLETPAPAVIQNLLKLLETLLPALDKEEDRQDLHAMMLDGAFLCGNYDLAMKAVDGGLRDRDADWHAMARTKILAHQALAKDDKRAAVGHFREFVAHVEKWTRDESDPTTGKTFTKEEALGLNWKRIGDLLAEIGDKDEARRAHVDARRHYEQAAEKMKNDAPEASRLKAEAEKIATATPS